MYKSELMGDRYVSIAPIAHRRGAANNVLKRVSGWVVSGFTFHPETSIRFVHHNFVPLSILLLSCNDGSPPFQFRISVWKEQPIFSSLSLFFSPLSPLLAILHSSIERNARMECKRTNNRGERFENSRSNCTIRFTMFSVSR